jgi:two-component system, OmpR family, osmolarity sensor histidine kinase EnvZ
MRLRDYTPRGYQARHILILIVPMIIFVLSMTLFFFDSHVRQVNTKLARGVSDEIEMLVRVQETSPDSFAGVAQAFSDAGLLTATFTPGEGLSAPPGRACCGELADELAISLQRDFTFAYQRGDQVSVRTRAGDGVIEARFDRKRVVIITAHIFIVWSVGFSLLLLAMSYAFLRNQVRSILQLAGAADAFGRGEDAPGFRPSGAAEVRQAARALIRMRNRMRRYADQRTAMLAGVSHDLRTPLTRLKLELALLPKTIDVSAARSDLEEMERMLDGYLAFARGEEGEAPVDLDLGQLAREATAHLNGKASVDAGPGEPIQMRGRPLLLKRAISNLANNASEHGEHVRVSVRREPGFAVLVVEDDGPGIPEGQFEDAFRPFSRLDASRNQNVSGVGLGLTIARDTARAHGGDVTLGRSEMGGLKATVRLPLESGPPGMRPEDA